MDDPTLLNPKGMFLDNDKTDMPAYKCFKDTSLGCICMTTGVKMYKYNQLLELLLKQDVKIW